MPEIKNMTSHKPKNGVALLITIFIMFLILSLSVYVLNFSTTESKIADSQVRGNKTYYLAEAGIQEMVWKLKNDAAYKNNFETDPLWTASFTRSNPFGADSGSYTVAIANTSLAHGNVISTGSININGKISQRIIKTYIYRALGQSGIGSSASFSDGNVDISSSNVNYTGGNAHSNGVFNINGASNVNVQADLEAVGNYNKNQNSTVIVGGATHAANYPPAAVEITMPAVDFDSNDSSSMKNRATIYYTPDQFEDLIENNPSLTLNGIIYVSGHTEIEDNINLTINGLLVVNGNLEIEDITNLTVNSATGTPSGIMTNGKMKFKDDFGNININGVLYSSAQLTIEDADAGQNFTINGGTASRKLTISNSSRTINIIFNNQVLTDTLAPAPFSPVLTVDHWEEEY